MSSERWILAFSGVAVGLGLVVFGIVLAILPEAAEPPFPSDTKWVQLPLRRGPGYVYRYKDEVTGYWVFVKHKAIECVPILEKP